MSMYGTAQLKGCSGQDNWQKWEGNFPTVGGQWDEKCSMVGGNTSKIGGQ